MAIIQAVPASYLKQLLEGEHHFQAAGGDTFKIALYSSSATIGPDTTAYTATGEISASGYTAGGATLTNLGTASYGTVGYTSFSPVSWSGSGISAAGAMIYNSTASNYTNPVVCVLSFGMTRYAQDGTFSITFPTNNSTDAIIRVNAPLT